jgi:2-amino-4-hydroxy-6-hydroxymethyldihydropteridine diphosphokinase
MSPVRAPRLERALIALGSNIGDKIATLRNAVEAIDRLPGTELRAKSSIYRTPPWGKTDQDWFANAVIAVDTLLSPDEALDACLAIEAAMGRLRRERWGPRVIDLDLLTHGDHVIRSERLTLPHPRIAERAFVMVPLMEVAPDLRLGGEPLATLLSRADATGIERIDRL